MKIDFGELEERVQAEREKKDLAFKESLEKYIDKNRQQNEETMRLFGQAINRCTEQETQRALEQIEKEKKSLENELKEKYKRELPKDNNAFRDLLSKL